MSLAPVLFVHGMWADSAHWNRFRRRLARLGLDTHAVTLLGHDAPQDFSVLRHVGIDEYIVQVQDEIAALGAAPVLVGHSMGALIAQKVAETTQLRCLVLLAPVAPHGIRAFTMSTALCAAANVTDAVMQRPFVVPWRNARYGILNALSPREQTVVYQSFLWESGRALRQVVTGAVRVDERKVSCPVLVAVGSRDRATPAAVAQRIANKYDAEFHEYPECCHFLRASRAVIDEVSGWIITKVRE